MRPQMFTLEGLMLLQGDEVGQFSLVLRRCSGCGADGFVYAYQDGSHEFLVARVFTQAEAFQVVRAFQQNRPANFHSFTASVLASNWWKDDSPEQIDWEHRLFDLLLLLFTPTERLSDVLRIRLAERYGFSGKTWVH